MSGLRTKPAGLMALSALAFLFHMHVVQASDGQPAKTQATEESIFVSLDRARLMKMASPASTIIVGNPMIADVAVKDARTLVITGKSIGTTNLIAVDEQGNQLADAVIHVKVDTSSTATIYRGSGSHTYTCNPECSATPAYGDNDKHFKTITSQLRGRARAIEDMARADNATVSKEE